MWLLLLKRFWPLIAGAGLLIGAWVWHASEVRSARQEGHDKAESEYKVALAEQREVELAERQKQAQEWQRELVDIQNRSVTVITQPVRLCLSPPSLPAADPASGPTDSSGGGRHAVQVSEDLAPALREYAAECERYRRALKAAQL